jgi:hypothetical protein
MLLTNSFAIVELSIRMMLCWSWRYRNRCSEYLSEVDTSE